MAREARNMQEEWHMCMNYEWVMNEENIKIIVFLLLLCSHWENIMVYLKYI